MAVLLTGAAVIDWVSGTKGAAWSVVVGGWVCLELGLLAAWIRREGAAPVERDPRWCVGCGYDLNGLPAEARVCPECGRARG